MEDIDPPIWREVIFPKSASLHELHRAIQILFGWYDYHLYQFEVEGTSYEAPDPEAEGEDSREAKLGRLAASGDVLMYTYDFGDDWRHRIDVLDDSVEADPGWIPHLVDGARQAPPEDCGGVPGFGRLVEALRRPLEYLEDDDRDLVEWAGDYDPDEFSVAQARHALLLSSVWGSLRRK
jgi:hypothetical protein